MGEMEPTEMPYCGKVVDTAVARNLNKTFVMPLKPISLANAKRLQGWDELRASGRIRAVIAGASPELAEQYRSLWQEEYDELQALSMEMFGESASDEPCEPETPKDEAAQPETPQEEAAQAEDPEEEEWDEDVAAFMAGGVGRDGRGDPPSRHLSPSLFLPVSLTLSIHSLLLSPSPTLQLRRCHCKGARNCGCPCGPEAACASHCQHFVVGGDGRGLAEGVA